MTTIAKNAEGSFFVVRTGEILLGEPALVTLAGPFANRASADYAKHKINKLVETVY